MKKILPAILVLLLAIHFGKILLDSGQFRKIENQGFGNCRVRAELPGSEDLEYSPALKKIFVSSDNRPEKGSNELPSGAIYAFSPTDQAPPERISPNLNFPFHPHGIALWEEQGNIRLFAVNHRPEESTLEVFDWVGGKLSHVRTYSHDVLVTPNDLLALGPEDIFISHDHGSRSHLAQSLEHFTRWGRGYLTHYDGTAFFVVDSGISFANGLAFDPKNKRLYLAAMLEKAVRVYDLNDPNKPLFLRSIPLTAGPDNIKLDTNGNLWVAAHPKLLTLKSHSEKHSYPAPSMVIRVKNLDSNTPLAEEVMVDDGKILPAASVALPVGKKIFLGAIYDPRILECDPLPSD